MNIRCHFWWLGREDSNLRMAESKSTYFAFDFKGHSEKSANFDPFPINRLDADSECATGPAQVLWCVLIKWMCRRRKTARPPHRESSRSFAIHSARRSDCLRVPQCRQLVRCQAEQAAVDLAVVRAEERGRLDRHLGFGHMDRPAGRREIAAHRVLDRHECAAPAQVRVGGKLLRIEDGANGDARLAEHLPDCGVVEIS